MIKTKLIKRITAMGLVGVMSLNLTGYAPNNTEEVDGSTEREERVYGYYDIGYSAPLVKDVVSELPLSMAKDIPQTYSSVPKGYVSPIRNQGGLGTCWAFAAVAAMESYALSHGLVDNPEDIDLSEYGLAYLTFDDRTYTDNVGTTSGDVTSCNNMFSSMENGGNDNYVFKTMSKWAGIMNETDAPYDTSVTSTVTYDYNDIEYILTDMYFINMADVDYVKTAVMENGAVTTHYYSHYRYTNDEEFYSEYYNYCYDIKTTNHAVAIVGWDDTIPKEKFAVTDAEGVTHTPAVDGGWLIKNSWGTGMGNAGYMYISYSDVSISNSTACVYAIAPSSEYRYNYQHDGATIFGYGSYYSNVKRYANVFTVKGNDAQEITAVSFAITDANRDYSISLYKNPTVDEPDTGIALLTSPVTGSTTYAGYYTVNLPETVKVEPGDTFSIVIEFDENTVVCSAYGAEAGVGAGGATAINIVSDNESYYDWGYGFNDIKDSNSTMTNFCIKAFAVDSDDEISASKIVSISSVEDVGLEIKWQRVKNGITYELYRGESAEGPFSLVYTGTDISYTDTSVVRDTDYYYYVRIYDNTTPLDSGISSGVYQLPLPVITSLSQISNGIKVDWSGISSAVSYRIYRSENGSEFSLIATVNDGLTYSDTTAKYNQYYYYKIEAVTASSDTSESLTERTMRMVDTTTINAYDLSVPGKVTISWLDAEGVDGYALYHSYRLSDGTNVQRELICTVDSEVTQYTFDISGLEYGINITYYIKAYVIQDGEKVYSDENYRTIYLPYPEVMNIKWYVESNMIHIIWDDYSVSGMTTTGYTVNVYESESTSNIYISRITDTNSAYSVNMTGVNTYYVTVQARNAMNNVFTPEQNPRVKVGGSLGNFYTKLISDVTCDAGDTVNLTASLYTELPNFDYQYQWYKAASRSGEGVAVTGATNKEYSFTKADNTEEFYYCIITARYNETETVTTNVVKVAPEEPAINVSGCTIEVIADQMYTGSAIIPTLTVKYGDETLEQGTDYTVSCTENINVGTAYVTITGINRFAGTKTATFVIIPAVLSGTFTLSDESYTGNAIFPAFTVKYSGKLLEQGTDYTVEYFDNTNIGTASIKISGIGNYSGTIMATFNIVANDLSESEVSDISSQVFTGKEIKPSFTVKYDDETLVLNTDYTVSYSNNINAGTATVTITGIGIYSGTKTVTFEITPVNLDGLNYSLVDEVYTGVGITKKINLTFADTSLAEGKDYTLEYENNVNVGTAVIHMIGKGNFTGTARITFQITPRNIESATVNEIAGQVYTGSAISPSVTPKYNGNTLVLGTDYTVSYSNNVNVGTATVTITGKGNFTGTKIAEYTISARNLSAATISAIADQEHTGSAITPTVTLKYGTTTLIDGTDYTVSYSNNINAGTATVTITGKGNFTGIKTATFMIIGDIPLTVTSSKVNVSQNKYIISKITVGTTVSSLLNDIDQKSCIKIFDDGVEQSGNTILKTGMQVCIVNGNSIYKSYSIIVTGDINGDGKVNITDMVAAKSHILKKSTLTGVQALGGDTNGDGKVNITDFIKIKGYILKKNTIEGVIVQ